MTYQQAVESLEDHNPRAPVLLDRLKSCSQAGLSGVGTFNCRTTNPSGRDPPFLQPAWAARSFELPFLCRRSLSGSNTELPAATSIQGRAHGSHHCHQKEQYLCTDSMHG